MKRLKIVLKIMVNFVTSILGWSILVPLSFCYPKDKNSIVFFGGYNGQFSENIKYFYIYMKTVAAAENINIYFLTGDSATYNALRERGETAVFEPSIKAVKILLSASVAIVDRMEWIHHGRFHLLFFARIVQLWHGVGFKKIELTNIKSNVFYKRNKWIKLLTLVYRAVEGRYPTYSLGVSTSPFYTKNVFSVAFKVY